ncbi:hypothetical protein TeGR_g13668, partial [Tetraparma gracilis]
SVEVDDAILKGLAEYFETSTTATSKEENELIDEVVGYEEQDWERIRGTVLEPVEYFQVLAKPTSMFGKNTSKSSVGADSDESVEGAWGKATVNIDISADRCLAFFWHHMSSESNAKFEKNNGRLLRMQVDVPDSHTTFTVTSAKSPFPGVDNRVYASKWSWRREENGAFVAGFTFKGSNECLCFEDMTGDLIFVFEALPDSTKVDYGANLKVVRAKSTGVLRFKPTNDDAQCEVTLVQHLDAAGFVPKRVVVAMIPQALSGVGEMRELFQRDDNIDGAKRSELAGIINDRPQVYTDDELDILDFMTDTLGMLKEEKFEKLESPDHFVHMSSVFKEESSSGILRATTTVDAPIAEVAAWEMAKMSRENLKVHVQDGGLDRDIVKINDHQNIYHVVYDFSIPTFLPRQWVNKLIWKWAADKKELTVVGDDVVYDGFPEREEYLRASSTVVVKYKQEAKVGEIPQTKVTYTQQVDLGGRIPKWVQNRQGVGQLMYLSTMRKRFDQSPAIETVSNLRLVTMIQNHDEPYTEKEEAILRDGASRLSKFDTTAKSRELKMLSRTTKAKLAYEAKDNYAYVWFRPMMDTIAQRLLESVGWGLKMRLYTGAGLSTMDLISDVFMIYTMKGDDGFSKVALGSIIVSALTTGFSAATISFDFDVNPKRRRDEPDFYGYIPDAASSRTLIFLCMIINCALLLLVRSVSMALLAMVGSKWVLAYLVSDMGLYFVYKILRRDLWHWVALEGAASVVESVLERFVVKVLVDFTGVVQFRGAGEMGASYFTFNMIMALAASFVATRVYYASLDEPEDAVMDESVAWTIVGGLSGLGVSFFACFLLLMKPAYRRTFFSTQTGYAWVQSYFVSGQTDEVKKRIFEHNKKQWGGIRDDVKAWTVENWERWEEETPAWFGDAWKAGVDDDMIPPESLRKLNGGGSARRRSSLGGVLGVSARVAPVGGGDLQ